MAYYISPSKETARVLRNSAETLSVTFYNGETATDADGAVTIGITDGNGDTVVGAGTATTSAGSGVYTYNLAGRSDLDTLTATWSGTFGGNAMTFLTQVAVIGGVYVTPAELRAQESISGETSVFPLADLVEAIDYARHVIDDYTGASWTYRGKRETLSGSNTEYLRLKHMFPRRVISASVDGTALTATQLNNLALDETGVIVRDDDAWTFTTPGHKVKVHYEHGITETPPPDIKWAAVTLARFHLLEQVSRIPDRATQVQSEFGNITLSQAGGFTRPTPLNEVNVILNRHRHRPPTVR